MNAPLLIIADDLTGAADSAARCFHAGLSATVALGPPAAPFADATAVTSDSRHLSSIAAAERVRQCVAGLREQPGVVWYKKIDSTLRGHIGHELDAMLEALGRSHAVICPAFPAQGRGLHNGALVLSSTHAAPPHLPHLPTLLAAQSMHPVALLPLLTVRGGMNHLAEALAQQARIARLLVVDGINDDDLHTIVAASEHALPNALLCGSAGLVGALAQHHAHADQRQHSVSPPPSAATVLLVIGSGSAMARRQIAHAVRHAGAIEHIIGEPLAHAPTATVLCLPEAAPTAVLDGPHARRLAEHLAAAAAAHIARHGPALLVLSGGDTAMTVLQRLGVAQLHVVRELLPGMPLLHGHNQDGTTFMVVLKAGNHGAEDALAQIIQAGQR